MFALLTLLAAEDNSELKILPNAEELILAAIAFGLLAFFMIKKVFPRVRQMLADRAAKIQGQMEEAERTRREADQVLEQYRAQLSEARAEVQKIIDEGKRTAEALKNDIVAKAEQQAQEIVRRAQADVAGERDRAMQSLRETLGDLSIQLASRVIEHDLRDRDSARAMVDRAIDELAGVGARGGDTATTGANGGTTNGGTSGGNGQTPNPYEQGTFGSQPGDQG